MTRGPGGGASNDVVGGLLADLAAERAELLAIVSDLGPHEWASDTPSQGWSVRDQVAHLVFFDEISALAVDDPVGFAAERERALGGSVNYDREHLERVPVMGPRLLERWSSAAERLRVSALAAPDGLRVPWYGSDMALPSMLSARIMEHWAHGHDVAAALGIRANPTDRLRHVAHLAVRARPYGYLVRGRQPPQTPVRVELVAPSGGSWVFGPEEASDIVVGSAEDFCLVLVRRRHVDDSSLLARGAAAREWLEIGQAYAGPPGAGPVRLRPGPE